MRALDAINAVVLRDGKRIGYNTDCSGWEEAFCPGLPDGVRAHVVQPGARRWRGSSSPTGAPSACASNTRSVHIAASAMSAPRCRHPDIGTLSYLDLDRFKAVNDACGDAAGDSLLRKLGAFLRGRLRAGAEVFRPGGARCPPWSRSAQCSALGTASTKAGISASNSCPSSARMR